MRTHLDLFSGIGGFALAASWAGFETVQFCEIDPFARQVLAKNFPGVPIHDDIRTLTGDVVGQPIDLLTGGFPCQPFSVVGKQGGTSDDRHLWPEMARVIDEVRPRWVLGENVAGLIPMALDDCLTDLEGIGYETWAVVVPACAVGAWHRRDRVWIVAHAETVQREAIEWSQPDGDVPGDGAVAADAEDGGLRRGSASGQAGLAAQLREDAADAEGQGLPNGRQAGEPAGAGEAHRGVALAGPERCGRAWWAVEPGVGRVASRIPKRVDRLKSLGNAIVPQVAYEIIRLMDVGS